MVWNTISKWERASSKSRIEVSSFSVMMLKASEKSPRKWTRWEKISRSNVGERSQVPASLEVFDRPQHITLACDRMRQISVAQLDRGRPDRLRAWSSSKKVVSLLTFSGASALTCRSLSRALKYSKIDCTSLLIMDFLPVPFLFRPPGTNIAQQFQENSYFLDNDDRLRFVIRRDECR